MPHLAKIEEITIGPRFRKEYAKKELEDLILSIKERGLLHPPVVSPSLSLIAGGRRMKAITELHARKIPFFCHAALVEPSTVPVTFIQDLDPISLLEAELEENERRVPLSWQERAAGLAEIHKMRKEATPSQTYLDTARSLIADGKVNAHPHALLTRIHESVVIAENLHDPSIAKARDANEAYALILKRQEESATAELVRRRLLATPDSLIEIRHGDALEALPSMGQGGVDLILCDPPYGMDAGAPGFRSRAVHHHNYADTEDEFKTIASMILREGFRICGPRANLFMFFHMRYWEWLRSTTSNSGWVHFPVPLIWSKSDSEGIRPWGAQGPARTYDVILFATKGEKGLIAPIPDVLRVNRVARNERLHAAEKPVELLRRLIECSTLPGDMVLDPCCGSGSTLVAAKETKRKALGIERDPTYHKTAMANVFGGSDAPA